MLVIPAIDLRGGKCVRLKQGDYAQETIFADDPADQAQKFLDAGAKYLHLVDLDGARDGRPGNATAIAAVVKRCSAASVPVQLGGGLRESETIAAVFEIGVARAIVGTRAVQDPDWFAAVAREFPGKVALGLDARDGMAAIAGWREGGAVSALEVLDRVADLPLSAIIYTDIARDGMLAGPNFDVTAEFARRSPRLVIASGGFSSAEDVLEMRRRGVAACILGRSLYEGTIELRTLLKTLEAKQC
jgi:phosphoribosylformimino-5-aminoimidazole carboxamide ribotide isomerase